MSDRSNSSQVKVMTTKASSGRATLQSDNKMLIEHQNCLIMERKTLLQEIAIRKLEEEVSILQEQAMAQPTTRVQPMSNWTHNDTSRHSKRYWQEKKSNDDLLPRHIE